MLWYIVLHYIMNAWTFGWWMYVCMHVRVWNYFNCSPLPDVPHFFEINRELPPTPQPTSTCNTEKMLSIRVIYR